MLSYPSLELFKSSKQISILPACPKSGKHTKQSYLVLPVTDGPYEPAEFGEASLLPCYATIEVARLLFVNLKSEARSSKHTTPGLQVAAELVREAVGLWRQPHQI